MAATATVNAWSEQLIRSLLPDQTPRPKLRKHFENFNRTLKHHNYARTNQFEVEERLNGLEEKFQVLNQPELSDALHRRRSELIQHQHRWLPDALDLLLRLSHHPLKYTEVERLDAPKEQSSVPASLKWSDIEEDPIDRRSRIWKVPDYSDFSSDDNDPLPSSADTSPQKQQLLRFAQKTASSPATAVQVTSAVGDHALIADFKSRLFWKQEEEVVLTESQVVREVLYLVQGYPTALFNQTGGRLSLDKRFKLSNLSPGSLESVLLSAIGTRKAAQSLRSWSNSHHNLPFMQVMEDNIKQVLMDFNRTVSDLQTSHLRVTREGGVVSLLNTMDQTRRSSQILRKTQAFVQDVKNQDPIGHLDILFDHVCQLQHLGDLKGSQSLLNVFVQTTSSYVQQVDEWSQSGTTVHSSSCFFIQRAADQAEKARFWQSWYNYTDSGPNRPPKFLRPFVKQIFTCGKTVSFARILGADIRSPEQTLGNIIEGIASSSNSALQPLATLLHASVSEYISSRLESATTTLQSTLQQGCNLSSTIRAISQLYLAASPLTTDIIDARLFSQLDRCQSTWNDRFLISDLLSEAYIDTDLDIGRVTVHSEPTPSSTLLTARRSVDVLANIAYDYLLPWPIANILLPETLASYRRASLLLMQVRRARYVLERRAYLRLRLFSTSHAHSTMSRRATGLYTTLLSFATTLYSHLTSCVISPLTIHLHTAITSSSWTVDDLISIHGTYLRSLEFLCLTAKNLKVLKDAVITLLDTCVEFSFSLSDLLATGGSGKIDEDEVNEKIKRLTAQFHKQLDFLIAGLRGVARSSAAVTSNTSAGEASHLNIRSAEPSHSLVGNWSGAGETIELLADSLESALVSRRR